MKQPPAYFPKTYTQFQNLFEGLRFVNDEFRRAATAFGSLTLAAVEALNSLTRSHTGFTTFAQLVHAPGDSLHLQKEPEFYTRCQHCTLPTGEQVTQYHYFRQLDLLATAYDMAQEALGSERRCQRS